MSEKMNWWEAIEAWKYRELSREEDSELDGDEGEDLNDDESYLDEPFFEDWEDPEGEKYAEWEYRSSIPDEDDL